MHKPTSLWFPERIIVRYHWPLISNHEADGILNGGPRFSSLCPLRYGMSMIFSLPVQDLRHPSFSPIFVCHYLCIKCPISFQPKDPHFKRYKNLSWCNWIISFFCTNNLQKNQAAGKLIYYWHGKRKEKKIREFTR